MKQVYDSDYSKILRLLHALSKTTGQTVKERENARKAFLLHRKLKRKDERENGTDITANN